MPDRSFGRVPHLAENMRSKIGLKSIANLDPSIFSGSPVHWHLYAIVQTISKDRIVLLPTQIHEISTCHLSLEVQRI